VFIEDNCKGDTARDALIDTSSDTRLWPRFANVTNRRRFTNRRQSVTLANRGHCLAFQEIFVQCISRFCRVCSVAQPKKCSCKKRVFETKKDRMSAYFHFHLALCNESTLMFRNQVLNWIESSSGEDAKIKCKNVCF